MFKSYWKLLVYGFLVWLVPFLISFVVYPIRNSNRALFESVMAVSLVAAVVFLYSKYQKSEKITNWQTGMLHGFVWFIISIVLDLFVFVFGPLSMTLSEYIYDIGLTYIVIIIITTGMGTSLLIHQDLNKEDKDQKLEKK